MQQITVKNINLISFKTFKVKKTKNNVFCAFNF